MAAPAPTALDLLPPDLRAAASGLHLDAGQRLFTRGARPSRMFYVLAGEVQLLRASAAGGETILQRVRQGFVAEASLEASRYHCDAVAAQPSELLSLPLSGFRQALDTTPAFARAWASHLAREVRRLRTQCERLNLKGAAARILHYLDTEGEGGSVTLTQTRKAWAAELGLSHEALYRTLAQLERDGRLVLDGQKLSVPPRS